MVRTINRWKQEGKTVSITIHDGNISGYVIAADGKAYTVEACSIVDLVTQIDNLLSDRVFRECHFLGVKMQV